MATTQGPTPQQTQEVLDETLHRAYVVLRAVWDGISRDYKSRYRADIWAHVQSRTAAQSQMTSDLGLFVNRLCSAFDGATLAPYDTELRTAVLAILGLPAEEQQAILTTLRKRTANCVLLLRHNLQEERKAREQVQQQRPAQMTDTSTWLSWPTDEPDDENTDEGEEQGQ